VKKLLLIVATAVAALVLTAQAFATPPAFITDTLAPGGGKAVPQQAQGYRFITDTLAPGGGVSTATVDGHGFNWSAAGVGALAAAGILLVLAGAALTAVRRRTVVAS